MRVLIVDDVEGLRDIFSIILHRAGRGEFAVVGEACDGQEAVRSAARLQPDLILLDISMPVMDGLEALPLIRQASPASRVVMLSGFDASRLADAALRLGAVAYLEKGIAPPRLVEELRRAASFTPPPLAPPAHENDHQMGADASTKRPHLQAASN